MFEKIIFIVFLLCSMNRNLILSDYVPPKIVKIGGIFFENEIEIDTYFKTAIEYVNDNIFNNAGLQFEPIMKYSKLNGNSVILQQIACELLDAGVVAIFGPSSKASSDIVASICNFYGIPHILFDSINDERSYEEKQQQSMTINIYPDLATLSKALGDIVLSYSWKSFAVIYETDEGLIKLQDILQLLPISEDLNVFHAKEPADYFQILKRIKYLTEKRIIIDCDVENTLYVLKAAEEFNMTDIIYSYFFTNMDSYTSNLKEFSHLRRNATGVRLKFQGNNESIENNNNQKTITMTIHDGIVLFANALNDTLKFFDSNMLETRVNCRRTVYWDYGKSIIKQMKINAVKGKDTFLTRSINFNDYGERIKFELDIYNIFTENIWLNWEPIKSVTRTLHSNNSQNILSQSSLKGNLIYVSTRIGEPYLIEKETPDGVMLQGNDRYKGFSLDLISLLSSRIGFTFEIRIVPDGKNGNYNPVTKEWSGIIGELREGKAHLGICDLTITHERKKAVEFTAPFMSLGVAILYYKVQPPAPNLFSFLDPFALEVWLYTVTAYLLISLLCFAMARISRDEWLNPHPCNQEPEELENLWNLFNTSWLSIGSIMQQGCDILPKSGSLRFVTGMWWFFALMMMNSYTANLAAFLTQSQLTATIEDLKDLPEQNKVKYGTVFEQSTYNFFQESNDSLYSKIFNSMKNEKPSVFTKDNEEGVKRVRNSKGKYAFLMETTSLEYNLAKYCDLMQLGKKFSDKHYGIAMPIGVSYRSELNVEILKLAEEGAIKQLKDKWWNRTEPPCETPHESSSGTDLSLAEVGGVFLVLGAGLFVSFLLGIAEFLWSVQRIAVEEKMTPMNAFKREITFAFKFWIKRKPIKKNNIEADENRSNLNKSRSRTASVCKTQINGENKINLPPTESSKTSADTSSKH